jgi:hopanoid-associated phosphorylase
MEGPLIVVCGLAFEAHIAAGPGVVTVCASGPALAMRLDALLAGGAQACRGILSFGCAGGLDPALRAGDCVLASAIDTAAGRLPVEREWLERLHARIAWAQRGVLAGVSQPLTEPTAKASLWRSSGACAVDMESHHAALLAQRHGLPFAACRVVVDPAHRCVPTSATASLREDGTTALAPILRELAREPGQLPTLALLANDLLAARRGLRLARQAAGPAFGSG